MLYGGLDEGVLEKSFKGDSGVPSGVKGTVINLRWSTTYHNCIRRRVATMGESIEYGAKCCKARQLCRRRRPCSELDQMHPRRS